MHDSLSFLPPAQGLFGGPAFSHFGNTGGSQPEHSAGPKLATHHTDSDTDTESSASSCQQASHGAHEEPPSPPILHHGSERTAYAMPVSTGKLPDFALSMQPRLLKSINNFHTKEELLTFVAQSHFLLDPINLVTCVYRLARMYCGLRHPEARQTWRQELSNSQAFQLLLRTIQSQMLHAQLGHQTVEVKGLDARCVSNVIWAVVKLDLATEPGCQGTELILSISPLVTRLLPSSSPQGLANLLWAYAKLPEPPIDVMGAILTQMTEMIGRDHSKLLFDAQALSNSVWALAHTRSKCITNWDALCSRQPGAVDNFLEGVAVSANAMLKSLHNRLDMAHLQAFLNHVEHKFSCQALVNIVWSFASILGEECGERPAVKTLFQNSKREAVLRLRATYAALQSQQPWVWHIQGGFNEQALSNTVYAYEKAGMLDRELLHWVFNVAALRLDRRDAPPSFKPQELCTLLRAAHLPISEPVPFLSKLVAVLQAMPWIIRTWSASEINELNRALGLLQPSAPVPQQNLLLCASQNAYLSQGASPNLAASSLNAYLSAAAGVPSPSQMHNALHGGAAGCLSPLEILTAELQQLALQSALLMQQQQQFCGLGGMALPGAQYLQPGLFTQQDLLGQVQAMPSLQALQLAASRLQQSQRQPPFSWQLGAAPSMPWT